MRREREREEERARERERRERERREREREMRERNVDRSRGPSWQKTCPHLTTWPAGVPMVIECERTDAACCEHLA